jgi:hypothetical protein
MEVNNQAPEGQLKETALLHIMEAMMIANAAVAAAYPVPPPEPKL